MLQVKAQAKALEGVSAKHSSSDCAKRLSATDANLKSFRAAPGGRAVVAEEAKVEEARAVAVEEAKVEEARAVVEEARAVVVVLWSALPCSSVPSREASASGLLRRPWARLSLEISAAILRPFWKTPSERSSEKSRSSSSEGASMLG